MKSRKAMDGNLSTYFAIFLGIIIVGYVFFILSDSLRDTMTDSFTATVTNGTTTLGFTHITDYSVVNGSTSQNESITTGFTFNTVTGAVTYTEANYNASNGLYVTGTYATNSIGYNSTGNIESGMENATEQLPNAGTLIGIGVILAVIGMAVYGARRYGLF